jgi:rsbT co-antagonist protein RsbR
MPILELDDSEIARRRALYLVTDEDLARLASLQPFAAKLVDRLVDEFYAFVLDHAETRGFIPNEAALAAVKRTQREYFLGLFAGRCDAAYVRNRLRVGTTHERIGLAPKLYLGAYRKYLSLVHDHLHAELDAQAALAAFESLRRLVFFDIALAIDTYIAASQESLARYQQALQELSTPVIRVYERVLLLPLVGAIDTHRAQEITNNVVLAVVREAARCMIIDIAGVAVVDTRVAQHLLDTTAAVSLLGAKTVLTGISPQVARTMVQLGIDLSSMLTVSRLSDGIELALDMVGKSITARRAPEAGRVA